LSQHFLKCCQHFFRKHFSNSCNIL
jgi:hypothetical protein